MPSKEGLIHFKSTTQMARKRIKVGRLVYSTNQLVNILAKRLIVEVRHRGMSMSYEYNIVDIQKTE
jgi:hypothetical protein